MNKTNKIIVLVCIIVIGAVLVLNSNKTLRSPVDPIKVGVIAPFSGPFADYGESVRAGILAAGTSSDIQFIFEDEKCEAKDTVTAFQKLTSIDRVHFILGPGCGSPQEAIVPLLLDTKTVVVVPSGCFA